MIFEFEVILHSPEDKDESGRWDSQGRPFATLFYTEDKDDPDWEARNAAWEWGHNLMATLSDTDHWIDWDVHIREADYCSYEKDGKLGNSPYRFVGIQKLNEVPIPPA